MVRDGSSIRSGSHSHDIITNADLWFQLASPPYISDTTLDIALSTVQAYTLRQDYAIVIKRRCRICNKKDVAIKELHLVCFHLNKPVVHEVSFQLSTPSRSTGCQFKATIQFNSTAEQLAKEKYKPNLYRIFKFNLANRTMTSFFIPSLIRNDGI